MNDVRLRELLRQADAGAVMAPVEAGRVRTLVRQRGRRRVVGAVAAMLGIGAAAIGWQALVGRKQPAVEAPRVAQSTADSQSAADAQIVTEVRERIAVETAIRMAKVHARGDYWAHDPALVRERAAETLVAAADRGRARGDLGDATATYALAARLFPETAEGRRASAMLGAMQGRF